jgi:6-pyruvoyltetrahydropterin/6-carboxytetrahydropterin synthase
MFSITVEHTFSAAHAIVIAGAREKLHGHNWRTVVRIEGDTLDGDGLLCDFHTVHDKLVEIVAPFENANLNDVAPFDVMNPTAELVAKYIFEQLEAAIGPSIAPGAWIARVSVTEAANCVAAFSRRALT